MSVFNPSNFAPNSTPVTQAYLQANYTTTTLLNAEIASLMPKAGGTFTGAVSGTAITASGAITGGSVVSDVIDCKTVDMSIADSATQTVVMGVNAETIIIGAVDAEVDIDAGTVRLCGQYYSGGGTYTPVIGDGTNNFTTSVSNGYWVKVGGFGIVQAQVSWTSRGSATGATPLRISLPVSNTNGQASATIGSFSGIPSTGQLTALATSGAGYAIFSSTTALGVSSAVTCDTVSGTGSLSIQITCNNGH